MKLLKKLKPVLKPIDNLLPSELEYFCTTQTIDKLIAKSKGLDFNQQLADEMEEKVKCYFVVKKNLEYDIIAGPIFEPWMKIHKVEPLPGSKKADKCIQSYINHLGY